MQIKQDDIIRLKCEKLLYTGVNLAHLNDGKTVFVHNAVSGDVVDARVLKVNKNYVTATAVNIVEPSLYRCTPFCPISSVCGGCNLQNYDYDFLCTEKENIIKEIFKDFKGLVFKPIVKSPKLREYRCKMQYPVSETKVSKRLLAGYYKEKTHEIVNIKYCPIQKKAVDEIINFIRENWTLGAFVEKSKKGLLKHIVIRQSDKTEKMYIILVLNTDEKYYERKKDDIDKFAQLLMNKYKSVVGVSVNLNPLCTNKILSDNTHIVSGEDFIYETLRSKEDSEYKYKIGRDSFFQVNPSAAQLLFDAVSVHIKENSSVLDAYGGVGAIGIFLSAKAGKITLVEENERAVKYAKENFKINGCKNYEVFLGDANKIFKDFEKRKKKFSHIVLDPPRKGSDNNSLECISKLTDSVIYVSCNPMTLLRDAKKLKELGFNLKCIQPVDMFPYTHHIESVAYFEKLS